MIGETQAENVEEEKPDRTFKITEEGKVLMTEKITRKVTFKPRQFITLYRNYEKQKEQTEHMLSDEYKEKLKDDLEKLNETIEDLQEKREKVEKIQKKEAEKKKKADRVEQLKKELERPAKERKPAYVKALWDKMDKKEKKSLTVKESKKVSKALRKMKR